MAHQEQTDLDTVMGHNMEDLLGLGDVFKMMGYLALRMVHLLFAELILTGTI